MQATITLDANEVIMETEFTVYYSTKNIVPIPKIIDALKSIESILHKTPKFVEAAYPGIKVYDSQVFINHLESGSLDIKVILRQVLGDAKYERGEKLVDDAKQLIKDVVSDSKTMNNIVIFSMGAIVATGFNYAIATKNSSQPTPAPVTIINNGIMNGSGTMILSPEETQNILEKLPQKQVAKDAVNFAKPTKDDPSSSIDLQDDSHIKQVSFDSKYVNQVPEHYEPPEQEQKEELLKNQDVYIYASDRDKTNSGWAGIVPELFEARVNFDLADTINPDKLHGKRKIKANILVHSKFNKTKRSYIPSKVTILEIV
ncbi:hypothetical protein SKM54_04625 [Acinetobacter faecalis]|uniref:hypothetical protein n=1 Tax=Acinetobacter faecalis TaxID=2665161 RepID=UPI002A908A37|nr:hypothetical protein [Acinetobacter faecalis]MDY6481735.1 hypothetical protein [Acinetobacter faecalis]